MSKLNMDNVSIPKVTSSSGNKNSSGKSDSSDKKKNKKDKDGKDDDNKDNDKDDKDDNEEDDDLDGESDSVVAEEEKEEQKKKDKKEKEKNKPIDKKIGDMSKKLTIGIAGAKVAMVAQLMMFLKMMLEMLMAIVQAVAAAAASMIATIIQIAITIAAMTGVLGPILVVAVVAVVVVGLVSIIVAAVSSSTAATRSDVNQAVKRSQCVTKVESVANAEMIDNTDAITTANAQYIYSLFHTLGLADENIAGIVGNWVHESGIDPTSIETMSGIEKFQMGERKTNASNDWNSFTLNTVFPAYANHKNSEGELEPIDIKEDGYMAGDGYYYPGIGLGQWTGPRALSLLNYAGSFGKEWYELDTQLAFCITPSSQGGDSRYAFFSSWEPEASPESAAQTFNEGWEGISYKAERGETAAQWFVKFAEWEVDETYANSLIDMAGAVKVDATNVATNKALTGCKSAKRVNNSTIADAAVAFAWEDQNMGYNNNGTDLFIRVHDGIFPSDTTYMACCRAVSCAVRWSGADDTYVIGGVVAQLEYLVSSDKWTEVTDWGGNPDNLLPGDVLIYVSADESSRHTVLYVGNEAIRKVYPNADESYCIVSGSLNERSPGCGKWYTNDTDGLQLYRVFRNVQKEENPQYTHVAMATAQNVSNRLQELHSNKNK